MSSENSSPQIFLKKYFSLNIVSSANFLIFKNLGILQSEFDRPALRDITANVKRSFAGIEGEKRKWSYVYSPDADFSGLLENQLPSFWSWGLSNIYAGSQATSQERNPKRMTHTEKVRKAKELAQNGWSLSQVKELFGVSKSTVYNWVHDYPYSNSV